MGFRGLGLRVLYGFYKSQILISLVLSYPEQESISGLARFAFRVLQGWAGVLAFRIRLLRLYTRVPRVLNFPYGSFRKLGVPYFGVLKIRILPFGLPD